MQPLLRRSTLPHGLRVVTEQTPGARAFNVGFFVAVGSRDESRELHGASHFLEHVLFKGTPTRDAEQISASIEAQGGDLNAYTTREYTCFHMRVLTEQAEIELKYEGYLKKQEAQVREMRRLEEMPIPEDFDYAAQRGLRLETIEKLQRIRPASIGQASRISGVSPADISVLVILLRQQ